MAKYKAGKFQGAQGNMNMQQVMRQAQKMQDDMATAQAELETKEVETSSGGGMVTVVVNGKKEVTSLKIKPEAVDVEDLEMLEDLVVAAVNEALRKIEEISSQTMDKVTGGVNIPGLF